MYHYIYLLLLTYIYIYIPSRGYDDYNIAYMYICIYMFMFLFSYHNMICPFTFSLVFVFFLCFSAHALRRHRSGGAVRRCSAVRCRGAAVPPSRFGPRPRHSAVARCGVWVRCVCLFVCCAAVFYM